MDIVLSAFSVTNLPNDIINYTILFYVPECRNYYFEELKFYTNQQLQEQRLSKRSFVWNLFYICTNVESRYKSDYKYKQHYQLSQEFLDKNICVWNPGYNFDLFYFHHNDIKNMTDVRKNYISRLFISKDVN